MTDKQDKEKVKETSSVVYGDVLYEQIYDQKRNISYYLGLDPTSLKPIKLDCIDHAPVKYIPIQDDLIQKNVVLLPTDAVDYGNEDQLEEDIRTFIDTWLEVSPEYLQKAAWYVMLTWIYDKLNTIPYLRALGDYGTGKTRFLDVIGGLCYKPMYIGGAVKSAPIYRVIDLWRGTAVFDEFTLKKSDESEDVIQILNNGYQRGKAVLRCDANNYEKVNAFDPFGPKLLASRKEFTDHALESRCITEVMHQMTRDDIPTDFTSEFYQQRQLLQNKLLMYRFYNHKAIDPDGTRGIDFGNVQPRIKQSLSPFTILFANNPDKLKRFIAYVQDYNSRQVVANSETLDGLIVNHYLKMQAENYPIITSHDIRDAIVTNGWGGGDLNVRTVGKHLKALGFDVNLQRTIGGDVKRHITITDATLTGLKKRYVCQETGQETGPKFTQETIENDPKNACNM